MHRRASSTGVDHRVWTNAVFHRVHNGLTSHRPSCGPNRPQACPPLVPRRFHNLWPELFGVVPSVHRQSTEVLWITFFVPILRAVSPIGYGSSPAVTHSLWITLGDGVWTPCGRFQRVVKRSTQREGCRASSCPQGWKNPVDYRWKTGGQNLWTEGLCTIHRVVHRGSCTPHPPVHTPLSCEHEGFPQNPHHR